MAKNWRPKNWDEEKMKAIVEKGMLPPQTEFPIVVPGGLEWDILKGQFYEAGADAMLGAFVEWAESIQDDEWLQENPTLGMCLSLDCWSAVGGGAKARSLFTYNKLKSIPDEEAD